MDVYLDLGSDHQTLKFVMFEDSKYPTDIFKIAYILHSIGICEQGWIEIGKHVHFCCIKT